MILMPVINRNQSPFRFLSSHTKKISFEVISVNYSSAVMEKKSNYPTLFETEREIR